ncbi:CUB domain-containing protein 1-like isoform X2 [Betta splendens]|uniref:CUB domain-containing protein 1-like isoform X2 n=1 Tax=Betta splendens TaxID=158456 RepID=A0A9W2XAS4_BETSP|nr:CUB domain-containing protein 1-like isoform X2 [Betta splendens]
MARGPTWPRPLLHLERALPRLWHGSAYGKWVEGEIAASPCGASRKSETTLWRKRCLIPVGRRREHSMAVAGGEQLLLLAFFVSTVSGAQKLDVTPDAGTSLIIGGPRVRGCVVCTGPGPSPSPPCGSSLLLNGNTSVSLDFNCSRPQDVFQVEIVRSVECSTKSCNGHIVQSDSSFSLLLAFNRTFTWNLNASPQTAFRIDFPKPGLRQIRPWEACEDGHSFTLQASRATGSATIGKYCREGSISSVQIQSNGRFSVEVPARQKLQNDQFNVSVGEEIQSFAKITLTFPEGTSSSELLSPNYPDSVPSSSVIEWDIQVPDKHGTSVQFQNISQPRCLKNMAAVEYRSKGGEALVRSLTDAQRNEETGNVSVTLRNCEMDMKRSTSGLSVSLRVSITQVRCRVNMSEAEGLALRVDKVRPTSGCKIALNSEMKDEITVASSGELSFQDCSPEDVQVTATRVIECRQLRDCPRAPFPLVVPTLPRCLPAPLSSVTWTFRLPQHATLELASPRGPLKQALPGQPCTDSLLVTLTEDSRGPIGDFCPQGAVERLQIHTNVSVTVSNVQKQAVKTCYKHALNRGTYSPWLLRRTRPCSWLLPAGRREWRVTPPSPGSCPCPPTWRRAWSSPTSRSPSAGGTTRTSACGGSAGPCRSTAGGGTSRPQGSSRCPGASTSTCPTVRWTRGASASSPRCPCRRPRRRWRPSSVRRQRSWPWSSSPWSWPAWS